MKVIMAVDEKMGIGKDGTIPWKFKEDLQFFKFMTVGCKLFTGRKTFESMGDPLPDRKTIVISRTLDSNYEADVEVRDMISWREMFNSDSWLIGGAKLFNGVSELGYVSQLFLSRIKGEYDCDTFIEVPEYLRLSAKIVLSENVTVEKWIK